MLNWALTFFVVALLAAIFGFTGIALAAAGVAKILFYLFLVLFLISLIGGLVRNLERSGFGKPRACVSPRPFFSSYRPWV